MAKFVEDELDEVVVKPEPVKPEPAKAAPKETPVAKQAEVPEDEDDETVEFGNQELMRYDGLERINVKDKGQFKRFALLNFVKPRKAMVHFVEKKGTIRCLTPKHIKGQPRPTPAICCNKLEAAELRIVALALEYTNASGKDGGYHKNDQGTLPPIEWRLGYVQLSRTNYKDISELVEEEAETGSASGTVFDIDLTMSKKDSGVGFAFKRKSAKARWRLNPELAKEVEEACQPYLDGKQLSKLLGKKVPPIEIKAMAAGLPGAASGAAGANLNDVDDL